MKFMRSGRIPLLAAVLLTGCQGPSAAPGALSSFQLGMFQAAPSPQPIAVAAQPAAPVVQAAPPTVAPTVAPTEPPRFGGGGYSPPAAPAPRPQPVGRLTVDLSAVVQTLFPPAAQRRILATPADVDHLVITIKMAGLPDVVQTVTAAEMQAGTTSTAFANLPTGTCSVVIEAFDASNTSIGISSRVAPIAEAQDTSVSVAVLLVPDAGQGYTWSNKVVFGVDLAAAPAATAPDGSGPVSGTVLASYPIWSGGQIFGLPGLYTDNVGHFYVRNFYFQAGVQMYVGVTRYATADGSNQASYGLMAAVGGLVRSPLTPIIYDPVHAVLAAGTPLNASVVLKDPGDTSIKLVKNAYATPIVDVDAAGDLYFPRGGVLQKQSGDVMTATTIPASSAFAIDSTGKFWTNTATVGPMGANTNTITAEVRRFGADGTLLGTYALPFPAVRIVSDKEGGVWVSDRPGGQLLHILADGTVGSPLGIATSDFCLDSNHDLWIAGASYVYKLGPDGLEMGRFPIKARSIAFGDGYIFAGVDGTGAVLKIQP